MVAFIQLVYIPPVTRAAAACPQERAEELSSLDSCEYIWAGGVGFARAPGRAAAHEAARAELLRLLLAAFSETIYTPPHRAPTHHNKWIASVYTPAHYTQGRI